MTHNQQLDIFILWIKLRNKTENFCLRPPKVMFYMFKTFVGRQWTYQREISFFPQLAKYYKVQDMQYESKFPHMGLTKTAKIDNINILWKFGGILSEQII